MAEPPILKSAPVVVELSPVIDPIDLLSTNEREVLLALRAVNFFTFNKPRMMLFDWSGIRVRALDVNQVR